MSRQGVAACFLRTGADFIFGFFPDLRQFRRNSLVNNFEIRLHEAPRIYPLDKVAQNSTNGDQIKHQGERLFVATSRPD